MDHVTDGFAGDTFTFVHVQAVGGFGKEDQVVNLLFEFFFCCFFGVESTWNLVFEPLL